MHGDILFSSFLFPPAARRKQGVVSDVTSSGELLESKMRHDAAC